MVRRGMDRTTKLVIAGFVSTILLVTGVFWILTTKQPTQKLEISGQPGTGDDSLSEIDRLTAAATCAGDPNPKTKAIGINTLQTTATDYITGTLIHFRDNADLTNTQIDMTLNTSTYQESTDGVCEHKYDLVAETQKNVTNALYLDSPFVNADGSRSSALTAGGRSVTVRMTNFTKLQARIKDVFQDGYMYENSSGNQKSFTALSGSANWTGTTDSSTCTTIAADENSKAHFIIELEGINKYGEFGMTSNVAFDLADDSNANDWQEPDIMKFNGQSLSNKRGDITGDDNSQLVAYEYLYKLPQTLGKGNTDYLEFKIPTGSGVNPDYSIKGKFLASGIKESSENVNQYLGLTENSGNNFFDDSSSYVEIATDDQRFLICII